MGGIGLGSGDGKKGEGEESDICSHALHVVRFPVSMFARAFSACGVLADGDQLQ